MGWPSRHSGNALRAKQLHHSVQAAQQLDKSPRIGDNGQHIRIHLSQTIH